VGPAGEQEDTRTTALGWAEQYLPPDTELARNRHYDSEAWPGARHFSEATWRATDPRLPVAALTPPVAHAGQARR
jgi:hypothetical protein